MQQFIIMMSRFKIEVNKTALRVEIEIVIPRSWRRRRTFCMSTLVFTLSLVPVACITKSIAFFITLVAPSNIKKYKNANKKSDETLSNMMTDWNGSRVKWHCLYCVFSWSKAGTVFSVNTIRCHLSVDQVMKAKSIIAGSIKSKRDDTTHNHKYREHLVQEKTARDAVC